MSSPNAHTRQNSPTHSKITKLIQQHFSSTTHAKVLVMMLFASLCLASTSLAQFLTIPSNLDNSIIAIKQIFLSTNGLGTVNDAETKIKLDGTIGNISADGSIGARNIIVGQDLRLDSHHCTSSDCVLTVNNQGVVDMTGSVSSLIGGSSTTNNSANAGEKYFAKKGSSDPVDNSAYDIYFADPSTGSSTDINNKNQYTKVRIGIESGGTTSPYGPQLITRGKIESREGFIIQDPTDNNYSKQIDLNNIERNHSTITTSGNILFITSTYRNPSGISSSNIILKSTVNNISTKVGINTPSNTYPTATLDVNGDAKFSGAVQGHKFTTELSNMPISNYYPLYNATYFPGAGSFGFSPVTLRVYRTTSNDMLGSEFALNNEGRDQDGEIAETESTLISTKGNSYFNANTGNVGFGTTTPSSKVDINGTTRIRNNVFTVGGFLNSVYAVLPTLYVDGSAGNVGIGTNAPQAKLDVNGNIKTNGNIEAAGEVKANVYYYNSDRRYKSDITPLTNALDNILKLNGYSYTFKSNGKQDIGVIAQEVEQVFPQLVHTDSAGYKSVEYGNLVAPLIEAVKELSHKIDALSNQIDQLFAKYADQQHKIDNLEARLAKLEARD